MRIGKWWAGAVFLVCAQLVSAQSLTTINTPGASPAAIQASVDAFRTNISAGGVNNGVNEFLGSSGRREINWDGVPNGFAAPNTFPGGFFNQNSQRGVSVTTAGTGFMVSDAASGGNGVGERFANLNASYPAQFPTFTASKLFTPLGGNQLDVNFFVPKTGATSAGSVPAVVRGFAVVFVDVDQAGTTSMQFFDRNGISLIGFACSPSASGLNFCGARVTNGEAEIARVRLSLGNAAIGPTETTGVDVVVLDDFIYGEPVLHMFANGFE